MSPFYVTQPKIIHTWKTSKLQKIFQLLTFVCYKSPIYFANIVLRPWWKVFYIEVTVDCGCLAATGKNRHWLSQLCSCSFEKFRAYWSADAKGRSFSLCRHLYPRCYFHSWGEKQRKFTISSLMYERNFEKKFTIQILNWFNECFSWQWIIQCLLITQT